MLLLRFALALSMSSFGLAVSAQDSPKRDLQATALLQQSVMAMGGARLSAVQDTLATVEGTVLRAGERASFTATLKTLGAKSLRVDANTPDGANTLVVADGKAFSRRGGEDPQRVPRMSVANGGVTHIPLLSIVAEWLDAKTAVEYVGLETIEGGDAHHIRLHRPWPGSDGPPEDLPPCDLFLDVKTLLLVRLVYSMHSPSDIRVSEPVTMTYGDYRIVSGVAIPHAVSQSIRGQVVNEFRVTSFAVNQGIALSEFELR